MPNPVGRILWGANFENVLELGWPLDGVRCGRRPREGSDWVRSPGGVEDAWITGFDYELQATARWFPKAPSASPVVQAGWDGATGVQAFLDWARAKNTFRYVPDISAPLFWADGCYLVDPMGDPGSPEHDGTWSVPLTIRNPTLDFGLALRGLMFEYAPGADISALGLNATFSRASVAGFLDNAGLFESAAAGVLMDRHYPFGFSGGAPVLPRTTLLQAAAANKLTFPEDMSNVAWLKSGTTVPSTNNVSPRGDLTASFVREDSTTGTHYISGGYSRAVSGSPVEVNLFVRSSGRTKMLFRVCGTSEANTIDGNLDTDLGTFAGSAGGTGSLYFSSITPIGNQWYWLRLYGVPSTGETAVNCRFYFKDAGGSTSYAGGGTLGFYIWGWIATDNQIAGMYWGTGASRAADNFQLPYAYRIQPTAILLDFIEQGSKYAGNGDRMIELKYGAGVWFSIYCSGSPNVGQPYGVTHSDLVVPTLAATPAFGDRVQLLALLRGDGSVELRQSLNLAADTTTGQSAAAPLETASGTGLGLNQFTGGGALADKPLAVIGCKVMPLTFGGQTIDTIAKARAA